MMGSDAFYDLVAERTGLPKQTVEKVIVNYRKYVQWCSKNETRTNVLDFFYLVQEGASAELGPRPTLEYQFHVIANELHIPSGEVSSILREYADQLWLEYEREGQVTAYGLFTLTRTSASGSFRRSQVLKGCRSEATPSARYRLGRWHDAR